MILIDLNQVMISNLMMQIRHSEPNEDLIRHMVLSSILNYKKTYTREYGDIVICCDDKNYWRKKFFPHYKAHRKSDREKSELDWNEIFTYLNRIRDEIKTVFPYKTIQVEGAEADDIIGTLTHRFGVQLMNDTTEKILILSGDKDFGQLQKYVNVDQYSPILKKWIKIDDPEAFLKEHIFRGDTGDGIPNIFSPDDCLVNKIRQKPLSKKKLQFLISLDDNLLEIELGQETYRNLFRNKQLIDLGAIPNTIKEMINTEYDNFVIPSKKNMRSYFIEKRLKLLIENIGEF